MNRCTQCGSYAINQHAHGRNIGIDLDLCDVCYWRKRADTTQLARDSLFLISEAYADTDEEAAAFRDGWRAAEARLGVNKAIDKGNTGEPQ